jgi:hypothetical protein
MMPLDQHQPNDFPFLRDSRVSPAMERHYLAWRSFDQGAGVFVAVETVARKLRVARSTVQRNLRRLQAVGLIQAKEQFEDGHQRTNFYLFPTPEWSLTTCCSQGPQNAALKEVVDVGVVGREGEVVLCSEPKKHFPSPLPLENSRWRSLWDLYRGPSWLLFEFFADLVQARQIREKGKPRKISDRRVWRWLKDARALTEDHPLDELQATLTWLFSEHLGQLPFQVVNEYTGRVDPKERRVTRLAQVLDHYPEIREVMDRGKSPETPPVGVEETVEVENTQPQGRWAPTDLSAMGVEAPVLEDQVNVLVELFTKTRRHPVSDFDLFAWRKTFRIMLTCQRIPYDDILLVVQSLGDRRLELDRGRYHSPYDLHRNGEWEYVLGAVKIALLREKNRPTPAPPPPPPADDDEEFYRLCGEEFRT